HGPLQRRERLMRRFTGVLVLAILLVPAAVRADEDSKAKAAADLKRYYEERLRRPFIITEDTPDVKPGPPPWEAPLKQLATGKAEERRGAAAYLRELVALALEHETSGKAPWRNTPYWGGGAEVPARDLRKEVAEALAKADALPDGLPLLRWFLEN